MDIQIIIQKLLNELEKLFNKNEEEINKYQKEIDNYLYLKDILEISNVSVLSFVEGVSSLNGDKKDEYDSMMANVIVDKDKLNSINQEIYNLYELSNTPIFDSEIVKPQKDIAFSKIEELRSIISEYMDNIDYENDINEVERLKNKNSCIIDFGTKYDDNILVTPIEDIDFLKQIVNEVPLSNKERISLLKFVLLENLELYNNTINNYKYDTKKENDITTEQLSYLDDLLERREVLENIIPLVCEEFHDGIIIDNVKKDKLSAIVHNIREGIIDIMIEKDMNVDNALEEYYSEKMELGTKIKDVLDSIFKNTPYIELTSKVESEIIKKAIYLVEKHKDDIKEIPYSDKEILNNYIEGLFKDKTSRIMMYKNKFYDLGINDIEIDASYEINYFLNLMRYLDKNTDKEYIVKCCMRIHDVLDSIDEVIHLENNKVEEDRNIIFFMKDDEVSFFEDDLNQIKIDDDSLKKNSYDLISNLKYNKSFIDNSISDAYVNLNELDIKYIENDLLVIYYIQLSNDNIIVVGVSDFVSLDNYLKVLNVRIGIKKQALLELERKIETEDLTIEDADKIRTIEEKINNLLKNENSDSKR